METDVKQPTKTRERVIKNFLARYNGVKINRGKWIKDRCSILETGNKTYVRYSLYPHKLIFWGSEKEGGRQDFILTPNEYTEIFNSISE